MGIVEILKGVGFAGEPYMFYVVLHGIISGDGFTLKAYLAALAQDSLTRLVLPLFVGNSAPSNLRAFP